MVFIIFGWGHTKIKDYGETHPFHCDNCKNNVYYHLTKRSDWFELFFIPVFPYATKHYLLCPICHTGYELKKEGVKKAEEFKKITSSYLDNKLTAEAYQKKMTELSDCVED